MVIVTNLGASSGKVAQDAGDAGGARRPVRHGGVQGRRAAHPLWYYNVRANPRVGAPGRPARQDMIAREVSGEERAEWWKRAVAAYPPYAEYQERTTREIPVFVLEPVAS